MPFTTVSTAVVVGVAAVVVLVVVVSGATVVVVVRVVVGGVDVVAVVVDVIVLLHDATTRARAIKPVLSSRRQWILLGNRFVIFAPSS